MSKGGGPNVGIESTVLPHSGVVVVGMKLKNHKVMSK